MYVYNIMSRSKKSVNILPNSKNRTRRFQPEMCDDKMTFQECEMAILRHAVDTSEKKVGERIANSPEVLEMIRIVEHFIKKKQLVCYGGTAINNILPKSAQFYNKNVEIPDYDFFSPNALSDAKELADIYVAEGYTEVEAKSGVHDGTYKVYVNFIAVADITYLHPILYASLKKESIRIDGIRYAPANYLRMGMFLELSRPEGDVSRWEKVLKRMNLLNKHYPLKSEKKCNALDLVRPTNRSPTQYEELFFLARDALIDEGVVFFGGYATSLYSKYMKLGQHPVAQHTPDFDVLSEDPEKTAKKVVNHLQDNGIKHIRLVQHTGLGEVVPEHIEVIVAKETVAMIYRTIACHSYNTITVNGRDVHIATIDTMLSFYLAFLYAEKKYYDKSRILCMAMYLFQVEQHNRLSQKGLLRRFSTKCYGKQETLESIRAKKARQYAILSKKPKSVEFESAFLKYRPVPLAKSSRKSSATKSVSRKSISNTRDISLEYSSTLMDGDDDTPTLDKTAYTKDRKRSYRRRGPKAKRTTRRLLQSPTEVSHSSEEEPDMDSPSTPTPSWAEKSISPSWSVPSPKKRVPHYSNWLSRLRESAPE